MKLKSVHRKISFIFSMLIVILTLFCVSNNIFAKAEEPQTDYTSESIISWVSSNNLPDGDYNVTITGTTDGETEETITYPVELINYYDDVTYTLEDADENGYIELGDDTDEYKMLIVKYHGNLTIEEGVTLTANTHTTTISSTDYELTYKKGMYIHVVGTLTNNGTISMTARGTYNQEGENVYLWKNEDGTYEYVPAVGGDGGAGVSVYGSKWYSGGWYYNTGSGIDGTSGTKRGLGGGGSGGALVSNRYTVTSGSGSSATSYSGGSGGGATFSAISNATGYSASSNGGSGGSAYVYDNANYTTSGSGGAGNPGGYTYISNGIFNEIRVSDLDGETGTGGLLIIFSNKYNNINEILSKGSPSSQASVTGGSSGGGSINVFYNVLISEGTTNASGGVSGIGSAYSSEGTTGGNGGTGTVTYTKLYESPLLTQLQINGVDIENFDSNVNEYQVTLNKYDLNFNVSAKAKNDDTNVTGLGKYSIKPNETKTVDIILTNDGGLTNIYTITVNNPAIDEHNSKLLKLEIEGYESDLEPEFHPLTNEYTIDIATTEIDLNIITETFDEEATVKIEDNRYIKAETGVVTVTVSEPNSEDTVYTINYKKVNLESEYSFDYIGTYQTFITPINGEYKIQLWGAQGGTGRRDWSTLMRGGYGAYTSGYINLVKGQVLYLYVGGQGGTSGLSTKYTGGTGGFNGGGIGGDDANKDSAPEPGGGGGGATDVRTYVSETGNYDDFQSLKSRIMVAGGGAGGTYGHIGGAGGTNLNDINSYKFGIGEIGYTGALTGGGGAGGGYYGGLSVHSNNEISYGGSSYISGHEGSDAIDDSSMEDNMIHTGQSIHYSGLSFTDTLMVDGDGYEWTTEQGEKVDQPTYDGTGTQTGNEGDGYAKITPISLSKDNYLTTIVTDKGELTPEFDPLENEYNVELGVDDTKIKISARPSSDLAVIEGLGTHSVPGGTTTYPIVVTAESGDVRIYNVNVTRPLSSESNPKNIEITGLVPSICDGHEGYCELDSEFNPDTNTYQMVVPAGIRDLEFTVEKAHDYQTVIGDGVYRLAGGKNTITIEVTSEDGNNISTYTYEITRDMTGNNYIDKLEIIEPSIDIGFNYLITEYSFKVDNDVTSLEMNIVPDDENASYEVIGNSDFKVGNNIVEIRVTAANGEERSYILNVYRLSNSNPLLSDLTVTNGETNYTLSPEFKDINTNYTLTVGNEVESVLLSATAQVDTTSISGLGSKTLNVGLNQFSIISTAEDGTLETYTIIITRQKNSNNYISNLTVSEGELTPTFNKETNQYSITVNPYVTKLTLGVTLEKDTSKYVVSGNSNFKIGDNLVTIKVTAEDGSIRNYYIAVTKEGSDNNYLSSLSVNNGTLSPAFDKEILEYNVEVENSVSSITITGTKEDSLSKVTGLGTYNLISGNNKITVRVTSETGITRNYIINVFRKLNSDSSLKDITLSDGTLTPAFDSNTLEYTVNVQNTVDKITVTGIANVNTSKVEGNAIYPLLVGTNEITLTSTAEDGTFTTYKVTVIRDQSSNANLSYLLIKEGIISPEFNSMIVNYTAKVPNDITDLNVEATPEVNSSVVTITGTTDLIVGENTVNVLVTAEDGTIKNYEIIVTRQEESNSNLNLKTLDLTSCTLTPEFSGSVQYYECEVDYEVTSTTVTATAEDVNNKVEGLGVQNLVVGRNIVGIKVINDELIEKDYQVVVTRKQSTESRLKNITIDNHTLNETFNSDIYEYSVITQDSKLNINVTKLHEDQTIEITGNENLILGLNTITIKVTSQDKNHESIYTLNVLKEKSDNNYLKNLSVEGYNISPTFNKGTLEYNLTVENEVNSIIVTGEKEDPNASLTGLGMYTLEKGLNQVKISVKSESGVVREYIINVTRLGSRNNKLSDLSVTDHEISPTFSKDINTYNLEVEYEVSEIEIIATAEDENSTITGDGIVSLKKGINALPIVVTSENGDVNTYVINVTRKDPITSKLENIEVKNYYLDKVFDPDTLEYIVTIDNEITSLDLIITKLDPNSTYEIIGNENFEVGLNEVEIVSTSSDGNETTTYKLIVNRQAYSNTYLNTLTVSNGTLTPTFDKTNLSYTVKVPYELDKITIEATPENITSTVNGTGEKELIVGDNIFKIIVTSQGGITRTYTVTVIRSGSSNANISNIESNIGSLTKLNNYDYELIVPNTVTQITRDNFIVTLEDPNASVTMDEVLDLTEENKIYKITVISADGSNINEYSIHVKYQLSSDSRIKELTSSSGTLSPTFDKDTYTYTLDVLDYVKEVEFTAILNDEKSIILNKTLIFELDNYSTLATILVQAEDGSTSLYTINIEKSITTEKNLEDITITEVSDICESCILPNFEETTYDYSLTVPYEIEKIGFEITKKHQNQQVKIYKDDIEVSEYTLDVGINNYRVEVQNSLGDITNYNYVIERLQSTNNYLSSLKLLSPEYEFVNFDKETLEYSVQIPYEYENVLVEAVPEDIQNASVKVSGYTYLLEGNNDVNITVKSASGDTRTYIIHVLRTPETNNLIKTLTVSSGDIYTLTPKFTPGINDYTLTVPSVISKITIEAIADVETTVISGQGEFDLKVGLNKFILESTSEEGQTRTYVITITRESSMNVYLKTLVINNGTLNETFMKEKTNYSVDIGNDVDILDMIIEPEDEEATVEVIGNSNLLSGENIVKIRVKSADLSASRTYTLTVTKEGSSNNNLLSLLIDGKEIEDFDPSVTEYNLLVENEVASVNVETIAQEIHASVSGDGIYSLNEGENKIIVTVTAENGEIKEYIINVTRKHNNYLSSIITDRGEISPIFDRNTLEYTLELENDIKDITIIGLKEDNNAVVTGNGKYDLDVGTNKVILGVTNGEDTREYVINVIRKTTDNTYLKYLTVGEGIISPIFDKETLEYTVTIPNEKTNLSLDYEPEDENATITVIGNENLVNETNEVIVRVTGQNGEIRDYKITVRKGEEPNYSNKLIDITVSNGTLTPVFDPDTNLYKVTVGNNISEIKVNAVRESTDSNVIGVGTYNLRVGRNVIQLLVTSKDGISRVYTIIVYREDDSDARLEALEFNDGRLTPSFNKNTYNYTLITNSDVNLITIKEIKTVSENASYTIVGDMTNIQEGNVISIIVTSADGQVTNTYEVTLKIEKSSNVYLKELTTNIGELTPTFNKMINSYKIIVPKDVNSIYINATSESTKSSITGTGLKELTTGTNYVNITVTAENGNTNVYSVEIEKEKSSDNNLKELLVRGYTITPEFDPDTLEYNVTVPNDEMSVIIDAEVRDLTATITGIGKVNLNIEINTQNIVVTAEDGSIKTYTINITREEIYSTKIKNLEIEEGVLSPVFNSDIYDYNITIPNEYTSITPLITLEEDTATYEIIGNENLKVGSNEIQIKVTSSNGEESIYTINVVRLITSNNYLKNITISDGTLTPTFEKGTLNYTVNVPNDITNITVGALPEVSTTSITGIGEYELNPGENTIILTATSTEGIERNYKVKVIREYNSNNYLSNLVVSEGTLSPTFDKTIQEYEVVVEEGTTQIEVTGTAEDPTSAVTGFGTYNVEIGVNTINIEVISESGELRIYEVNVIRNISSNTNITNLTPSSGILSPTFDNDILEYELKVDKDTNIVDFEVALESSVASVTGNKNILVDSSEKQISIVVTAEDGTEKVITITILKESAVEDILLQQDNITLGENEEYQIDASVIPEDVINKELMYVSSDETIVSVDENGRIIGNKIGSAVITITSKDNINIEKTLIVNVVLKEIKSDIYDVLEKDEGKIVIGADAGETIGEFIEKLLNDNNTVEIYDKDDNKIDDYNDIVKTGLIIKLVIDNIEYDHAIMIVRGDINEDGNINVTDKSLLQDHILLKQTIDDYRKYAADINSDDSINVTDKSSITDYILLKISTLN